MGEKTRQGQLSAYSLVVILLAFPGLSPAHKSKKPRGGVGVEIKEAKGGQPIVTKVIQGGPADMNGIRPGDVITHIEGTPTPKIPFQDISGQHLIGDIGTKVHLIIHREGTTTPLEVNINRWQIIPRPQALPETGHNNKHKNADGAGKEVTTPKKSGAGFGEGYSN